MDHALGTVFPTRSPSAGAGHRPAVTDSRPASRSGTASATASYANWCDHRVDQRPLTNDRCGIESTGIDTKAARVNRGRLSRFFFKDCLHTKRPKPRGPPLRGSRELDEPVGHRTHHRPRLPED